MKFVALVALSLALAHAVEVQNALEPQTLLQGTTNENKRVCSKCPVGQIQTEECATGRSTQCQCAPGRAGAAGSFDVGTKGCYLCGDSEYTDEPGQESCKACPDNTEYSLGSRTRCACKAGFVGLGTHANGCVACNGDKFQKMVGQATCKSCDSCPSNTNAMQGGCDGQRNSLCECSAGFAGRSGSFEVGTAACQACGENTYQDAPGQESCNACPTNSARSTSQDATKCFCDVGFAGTGKGAAGCAKCGPTTYQSAAGQSSCIACSTCTAEGFAHAKDCEYNVDASCRCAAGFHGTAGDFVHGQGECEPCDANEGQYQDLEGQGSCKDCVACGEGEVQAEDCTATSNRKCYCGAGYSGSTDVYEAGSGACNKCGPEKYNDGIKAAECKSCGTCDANKGYQHLSDCSGSENTVCECAPGHSGANSQFGAEEENACTACQANFFQDQAGQDSCTQCPQHSTSPAGATVCECDAGYTGDGKTSCSACASGTYKSSSGSAGCTTCASGSTTTSTGSSECVASAGYTKSGDTFSECPANTYKSAVGNSDCVACVDNSSSGSGSTSASDCTCNDGFEANSGACTEIKPAFVTGTITQFSLTAKTITFSDISDPIVFVSPLTYNGGDSAVTRVVAGNNQYSVEIEEPDCLDQRHPVKEECHWMVIEKGDTAYGGSTISVFTAEADVQSDVTISFPSGGAFGNSAPTCFTYIQSKNNDYYLSPRIKSTTASNVVVRIETDESHKRKGTSYDKETLGFVCFAGGVTQLSGDWGNFIIKTATTTRGSMNKEYTVNLGNSYTKAFAQMMSVRGGDPTILRHKSFSNGDLKFRLQEDRCKDRENFHVAETVAVLGFQ